MDANDSDAALYLYRGLVHSELGHETGLRCVAIILPKHLALILQEAGMDIRSAFQSNASVAESVLA